MSSPVSPYQLHSSADLLLVSTHFAALFHLRCDYDDPLCPVVIRVKLDRKNHSIALHRFYCPWSLMISSILL